MFISALELRKESKVNTGTRSWLRDRIRQFNLKEGRDFIFIDNQPFVSKKTAKKITVKLINYPAFRGGDRYKKSRATTPVPNTPASSTSMDLVSKIDTLSTLTSSLVEEMRVIKTSLLNNPIKHMTIEGYAMVNNVSLDKGTAIQLGLAASKLCQRLSLPKQLVPHPEHKAVGSYPLSILRTIFNEYGVL